MALTADAMSHQADEYLKAGMDAHVAKPFEATTLLKVLEAMLEASDEAASHRAVGQ